MLDHKVKKVMKLMMQCTDFENNQYIILKCRPIT